MSPTVTPCRRRGADAMAAGFIIFDLLDPYAVELVGGSLPEMEASPSKEAGWRGLLIRNRFITWCFLQCARRAALISQHDLDVRDKPGVHDGVGLLFRGKKHCICARTYVHEENI